MVIVFLGSAIILPFFMDHISAYKKGRLTLLASHLINRFKLLIGSIIFSFRCLVVAGIEVVLFSLIVCSIIDFPLKNIPSILIHVAAIINGAIHFIFSFSELKRASSLIENNK